MPISQKKNYNAFLWVFFASGFAGLIYQSIWSHYLGLFLGHAAYAQALVLSIFMGGMALGAALVSKWGWRWRELIKVYAIVELLIGIAGVFFHFVFDGVLSFSYETILPTIEGHEWIQLYKWLIAVALILPQTVLLGMTFPLMSAGLVRKVKEDEGAALGVLYFSNSIGAALGVLLSVFVFIPEIGLRGAITLAGLLNIIVAVAAWTLSILDPDKKPGGSNFQAAVGRNGSKAKPGFIRLVVISTFFSGAASFVYEIVWIRMLGMAVGSTLQAFEIMLASFIAGIALGGLWAKKLSGYANPLMVVGWMQVFMGGAALLSLVLYAYAFEWVGFMHVALNKTDQGYLLYNFGTAGVAIFIMMPAAFFAGTTLPLFTLALLRQGEGEGAIGRVYAWNTLGAIFGVIIAIHFIIPRTGLKLSLMLAASLDIIIGLAILRLNSEKSRDFLKYGVSVIISGVCFSLIMLFVPFDPLKVSSGVFRHGNTDLGKNSELLFYKDGKTASVAAVVNNSGVISISTNGKPDASINVFGGSGFTPDEPTMILLGAIPYAYVEDPRLVGIIGFGSGLTTHTVLANTKIHRVDTIEIEPAMVEGAKVFGDRVSRAYQDPRSNIIIDDAKSFFSSQKEKYDVVISEPSNPWISGVGSLFSQEFYSAVPSFLSDSGVFVQWLQLYEINDQVVSSVLNAVIPEFQDYHAYLSNNGDLLIVAGKRNLDEGFKFERVFELALGADLARVGVLSGDDLAFRKVADARVLRSLARMYPAPANSDYFPILSLNAPITRFKKESASALLNLSSHSIPVLELLGVNESLQSWGDSNVNQDFMRSVLADRARFVVQGGDVKSDAAWSGDAELQYDLNYFNCQDGWTRIVELKAAKILKDVVEGVSAHLPTTARNEFAASADIINCQTYPKILSVMRDFARSAILRDEEGILESAAVWFEDPEIRRDVAISESFDPVVLGWWQVVLASRGEVELVKELEINYAGAMAGAGRYSFLSSFLHAWLDEG